MEKKRRNALVAIAAVMVLLAIWIISSRPASNGMATANVPMLTTNLVNVAGGQTTNLITVMGGQTTNLITVMGGQMTNIINITSKVELPDGVLELLKSNTNRQVVVNNTFQMPDSFADNQQKISAMQIDMSKRIDGVDHAVGELSRRLEERERQEKQRVIEDIEVARGKLDADKRDAMAALFAINHINWVVTKIKTYNDPIVLEEEYKGLTADALNLRVIKDPELIDLICRILDVIVEMRIEEKERAFLKDELDQGTSDAFADAVSGIRISGLNPISMVVSAVTSVASAALNYKKAKRALQKKFERQSWALDKNRMYYLNDLNKELLRDFWAIVQKYPDLPDEYRISEKNIQLLVDHLKDDDAKMRFEFLRAFQEQFAGFQPYWYHRAAAAYEVCRDEELSGTTRSNARDDARFSLKFYIDAQIECDNILRKDPTAAKAALLHAAMLSEEGSKDKEAYRKAIKVITRNSTADDWQTAYFCALIAVRELDDIPLADKILAPAIAELEWQRRRRLVDWKDEVETKFALKGKEKVGDLLTTGDALYECRTLIANVATNLPKEVYANQLARICEDENASMREKMFCYGAMGYKQALEKLRPDVSNMRVYKRILGKEEHYLVSVPFSWVIARGATMALRVAGRDREEVGERDIEEREDDGKQYVLIDYGEVKNDADSVSFCSRFDRMGRDANNRPEEISYMVEVAFKAERTELQPQSATFGRWEKGGATTPSQWRMIKSGPDAKERPDVETIEF